MEIFRYPISISDLAGIARSMVSTQRQNRAYFSPVVVLQYMTRSKTASLDRQLSTLIVISVVNYIALMYSVGIPDQKLFTLSRVSRYREYGLLIGCCQVVTTSLGATCFDDTRPLIVLYILVNSVDIIAWMLATYVCAVVDLYVNCCTCMDVIINVDCNGSHI